MKIFGREYFKRENKKQFNVEPMTQNTGSSFANYAFSTPFLNIGDGNLSLPYINKYYIQNNIVRFGADNLYPQLLTQLYYTSAIHGACIDFITNATIGGGYEWTNKPLTGKESVELITFERFNKFKKMIHSLTRDYVIHRRVTVLITKKEGKITKLKRLNPDTIRNNYNNTAFVYSNDWHKNLEMKEYKRYNDNCGDGEFLYVYQEETPGQDVYPIPTYNSILNWAFLDGEQSFFHKSNIQNSIFPSIVIRRPKQFGSANEIDAFKEQVAGKIGAKNAGRVLVLTGNGMDDVPDIVQINANNNDKLFVETAKELKDNICFAHKINPAIMGIKVAGSLGNAEELQMSYAIFEKNVIMPLRDIMEEIFNDLISIYGIGNFIKLNDFQIIEKVIREGQVTTDTQMSTDGAADKSNASLATVDTNDALKGLSAAENADMYRIIRDHSKGKLNDVLAIARLKGYGIDDKTARDILGL